ncbi:MAG TPA: hypothetical protein VNS83_07390 [Lapillicoccus sp.]|nr:hypothetical protein [Lapillicoccus sp.]
MARTAAAQIHDQTWPHSGTWGSVVSESRVKVHLLEHRNATRFDVTQRGLEGGYRVADVLEDEAPHDGVEVGPEHERTDVTGNEGHVAVPRFVHPGSRHRQDLGVPAYSDDSPRRPTI